ncbi:outer membrane beta-barrel protein [Carboxylicivirga marina]|uniref:Outer membrane beta-barrel protein n=1 Tax=Carboxylicivirga marina TaxID=2800988 RepID=A0ABS1HP07_9BACT|nr:outer membrane beta-barrel protein [Carboxylicivirga marina]MBK3519417.1 outer membrane beta-barrel protein [Carboxylicivirga marina]
MKKNILIIIALTLASHVFAQSFDSSKIRAGGGLIYATEFNNIGLTFNGVYAFNEKWEGAFGFTHIFEKDYISANVIDLDAHYVFSQKSDKMNFYALAGLAINMEKFKFQDVSVSETFAGFNIGVGMNYLLSEKINLAPDFRYTIMDGSYLRFGASIQYLF